MKHQTDKAKKDILKEGTPGVLSLTEKVAGLTEEEVESRILSGDVNSDAGVKTKSVGEIVYSNLVTPFNILNTILGVMVLIFGSAKNALFLIVVVCNAAVGIIQELRAKRLVDRLSVISAPKATVIRDGEEKEIPVSELVRDDVMRLFPGKQVCSDCVILSGRVEMDESLLTGESDLISKTDGEILYSGSSVVSGSAIARVVSVGRENFASKITAHAKKYKKPSSQIMDSVNKIIKTVGIAIIPVGIALFIRQYTISGGNLYHSVTATAAALVGMIPEGLVLLTSVVLAVGTIRLASKKALVQELYSIEMLARVDVICLDKTGTITEGRMKVEKVIPAAEGDYEELTAALSVLSLGLQEKNATSEAVEKWIDKNRIPKTKEEITDRVPFSSVRKWSAVLSKRATYIMGAPDFIQAGLSESMPSEIRDELGKGNRVVAVAVSPEKASADGLPENIRIIGFVVLSDVIREGAPQMLQYFKAQGVDIKIISGDDPVTVSRIAEKAGFENAGRYVDASSLVPDEEGGAFLDEGRGAKETYSEAIKKYTVFGRVTPAGKLGLIRALKDAGHTVAMTGDGVNDVMALRESDCSIAPASGSEAARNVSQIVLMNSDFNAVTDVVAEGRRSINNLQRSSSLFLTKTVFATLIAFFFIFIKAQYPFSPIQFTLVSALTIGAPSFILALQPNFERVKGNFLLNIIKKALPGALTDVVIVILISVVYSFTNGNVLSHEAITTLTTILIAYVGFMVLFKVCVPFDRLRVALFTVMVAAFVLAIGLFPGFFGLTAITGELLGRLIAPALVASGIYIGLVTLFSHAFSSSDK